VLVGPEARILARAKETLDLMHRWGYAPTVEALAQDFLDGRVGFEGTAALRTCAHLYGRSSHT